jgi:hypothetical protein
MEEIWFLNADKEIASFQASDINAAGTKTQ